MTRKRLILAIVIVLLLLALLGGAGAWYYLYGKNAVVAADLVPDDTVFFATIPNAAQIATDYETSHLKTLVESPNTQPLGGVVEKQIGDKNLDLINTFLPNLSGQSFIAVTHFDSDHPEKTGFIAAMKPKPGLDNFDAFVDKLKSDYGDFLKQGTTGTGNVDGVDYQYLQGPGATDKICVAKVDGWIVTTWGEASLQDWVERYQKKSSTPSLAKNPDYQKSLTRIGANSLALFYFNYHTLLDIMAKSAAKNPRQAAATDYLTQKLGALGGTAMGMNFENGEIVDHFSMLLPKAAQLNLGVVPTPCAYETLNFTGPDTLFYMGNNTNWNKVWESLQEQSTIEGPGGTANPLISAALPAVQNWAQANGIDFQHNILDALGPETSLQIDWGDSTPYPEAGFFVKLSKPDDFQPVIKAIIETVRKTYESQAVINEVNSGGHNFATLKFVTEPIPFSPTITEDGPYLGVFLTEQQAVRSFERQEPLELTHNADFTRQIGDKRNGSAEIVFLDSPRLLDKTYRATLPYLSIAAMLNPTLSSALKGYNLPQDLTWLAPMGTWSVVFSTDDDGMKGYSVSGIGNQGLYYGVAAVGGVATAYSLGYGPKLNGGATLPGQPQGTLNTTPGAGPINTPPSLPTNAAPATPAPNPDSSTNAPPAPAPETSTNTAPTTSAPTPDSSMNAAPATPAPTPDTSMNAPPPTPAPTPDSSTNAVPTTSNSDANPPTPEPTKSP